MATVGTLGGVTFYVRSGKKKNKMLSFHDLARNSTAQFGEHERNGRKSYLEFDHPGLDEISFIVEADARYGVKPLKVQSKLHKYEKNGTPNIFVVGGRQIGSNPFVITSITDTYKILHTDGRPIAISFQITLREYANKTAKVTTIPAAKQIGENRVETTSAAASEYTAATTYYDTYTVVKGDCLWSIAKKYYGSGTQYTKIYNANRDIIKNPSLIYPGQVLKIPK